LSYPCEQLLNFYYEAIESPGNRYYFNSKSFWLRNERIKFAFRKAEIKMTDFSMFNFFLHLDTKLFLFLNGINFSFSDPIMVLFSDRLTWIPFFFALAIFMYRKYGYLSVWPLTGITLVIMVAIQASIHLFKNVFERLRPCHRPDFEDIIHLAADRCWESYAFVSTHAAVSFGVAVFLLMLFKVRWFTVLILSWAMLVSYSRIYLGVHYPSDIIVGAFVGAACGYGIFKMFVAFDKIKELQGQPNK
jgi:undecaprenyl-diphosphatase